MTEIARLPGNAPEFAITAEPLPVSPVDHLPMLFLGSSVTAGAASLGEGIPEYFALRFSAPVTRLAVSGTTLCNEDETSYVSRLQSAPPAYPYHLFICQLSTNDATQKKPLGQPVPAGTPLSELDTRTVAGAIQWIITYVTETWHCPIAFYTGSRYESAEYVNMLHLLETLRKQYCFWILDLWHSQHFNAISAEKRRLYMADDIHPTRAGYLKWWCPELERQLCGYLSQRK